MMPLDRLRDLLPPGTNVADYAYEHRGGPPPRPVLVAEWPHADHEGIEDALRDYATMHAWTDGAIQRLERRVRVLEAEVRELRR